MLKIYILLLLVRYSKSSGTRCAASEVGGSTTQMPCGGYGFRCIDEQTYQICQTVDSEGNMESPELSRECMKGLVCDEENPAFCTPIDEELEAAKKANELRITRDETSGNELFDKNGEEITSCYKTLDEEIASTTPFQEDDDDTTPNFVQSEYDCHGYGQFPDTSNKSLYWVCEWSGKGAGYSVQHLCCGGGRIFDARLRECVTVGTTRDIRSTVPKQSLLRICRANRKTHRFRLKRGDCENYYLCYNHNRDVMKMQCPRYYQFSDRFSRCMPESLVNCEEQNKEEEERDDEEEDRNDYFGD